MSINSMTILISNLGHLQMEVKIRAKEEAAALRRVIIDSQMNIAKIVKRWRSGM